MSKNGFRISDFGCRLILWTGADASFLIAFLALGTLITTLRYQLFRAEQREESAAALRTLTMQEGR